MTPTQILRVVKAAVAADNIYIVANRIGVQHSTLTRYLFGQKIQQRVADKIAAFAGKPPKKAAAKKAAKPAKKAKASKPKAKKKAVKKKVAAKKAPTKAQKAVKRKKAKASKPRASKPKKAETAAPPSGPSVVESEGDEETAAE
jgi:hypothetical protein